MTTYDWIGSVSTDPTNAANWLPNGVPTTGDTAQFGGAALAPCIWTIPIVDVINIQSDFAHLLVFNSNAIIENGLSINRENSIDSSATTTITFNGTPSYKSNLVYIENNVANPFLSATARNHLLFLFDSTTIVPQIDAGTYPHLSFTKGFRVDYVAPTLTSNKYTVSMLSLLLGNDTNPTSAVPTSDDRLMNWTIEGTAGHASGATKQFDIKTGTTARFDGGYGTWTFQAKTGGYPFPVNGSPLYNGWQFTFRNVIIDSSTAGSLKHVSIAHGCILSLTNLTINGGALMKGHDTMGATVHLINRPVIKGSWGFFPIADGIYHYKGKYNLSVGFGGTGVESIPTGNIVFGSTPQSIGYSSAFTFDSSSQTLTVGSGGITFADGTTQTTAGGGGGGGGIGVNVQDEGVLLTTVGTTLNFVDGQHPVQTVPTTQPLCVEATGTGAVKTITIDGSKIRCNATDTLPTYLDAKLLTGSNMSITLDTSAAASTGHGFRFDALNNKVKISSGDTTENFLENKLIAGTGVSLTKINAGGNEAIEITTSSSAAGFMEKFKHDQTPNSTTPFSPFRILANNDIVSTANVNVFSPDTTSIGQMSITINSCGNVLNAGKEILFYGQDGVFGINDNVIYSLDTQATDGTKSAFISHMHQLNIGAFTQCFQSINVKPNDAANSATPSVVRVIDIGLHSIIPAIQDINGAPFGGIPEDTPENVRILLVVDYGFIDDGSGRLQPNFGFSLR